MSKTILFIDGENFIYKIEQVLKKEGIEKHKIDLALINFNKLFKEALKEFTLSRKIFYNARLHFHKDTPKKSGELIKLQRKIGRASCRERVCQYV